MLIPSIATPTGLSMLDAAWGGARGVERPASDVAFGDHGQALDIYRPKAVTGAARLPVVIFFYGGGWDSGTRQGYAFAGRAFAARGFVVIVPDYRKAPASRFPAFVQDGAQAVRWVQDHIGDYGGDPARIALVGHSAGAHIAALLTLDRRWLNAAGVRGDIPRAAVGLAGPYDFYPFDSPRAIAAMGDAVDPARSTQPIASARADAPPMLLATGDKDDVVEPRNTNMLTARLQALGAPVERRIYAGIDHVGILTALSTPFRRKAPVLDDADRFLKATMPPR